MLVIFDLDGTLFETGSSVIPAVRHSLRDIGMEEVDDDTILSLIGERTPVFCEKIVGGRGDKFEEFRGKLWYYEHKYIGEMGKLFPGIKKMLKVLKERGFILAVCSNGSQDYVDYVLEVTDIAGYFDERVSSSQMKSKKVAIEGLMGSYGKEKAVMVGDKRHDFSSAKKAGIPSIGVSYGYGSSDETAEADFVVDEPSEIVGSVLNIFE
ncbi:MAG: HAD family hydrolase [Thermoplasmata archaeon]